MIRKVQPLIIKRYKVIIFQDYFYQIYLTLTQAMFKLLLFTVLLTNLCLTFFLDYTEKPRFPQFQEFKTIYQKNYESDQESQYRKNIFQMNLRQLKDKKGQCPSCGITQFSDLTQQEFQNAYSRHDLQTLYSSHSQQTQNKVQKQQHHKPPVKRSLQTSTYPKSLNWNLKNIVTSVKTQGNCSACWAFSTAALAQSTMLLRKLVTYKLDLSQQFLIQCTEGSSCSQGNLQQTMATVLRLGTPSEQQYPYDYSNQHKNICQANSIIHIQGYRFSKYHATDDQLIALLNKSPLNILISSNGWQNYNPAQVQIFSCSNDSIISHSALLVGYSQDFWIVKNSWGSKWGLSGYIYINRSRQNSENCLIGSSAHYFQESCLVSDCSHCMTASSCLKCNVDFYRYYPIHDNQTSSYQEVICVQCLQDNCLNCFSSAFKDKFVGKCQQCQNGYTLNMTNDLFTCFESNSNSNNISFLNCLISSDKVCTQCYQGYSLNKNGLCQLVQNNQTISDKDDKSDHTTQQIKQSNSFSIVKLIFIVFFLLVVILIIILVRKKIIFRNEDDTAPLSTVTQKSQQNYNNFNEEQKPQLKDIQINQVHKKHQISINDEKNKQEEEQDPNMINSASDFAKFQQQV